MLRLDPYQASWPELFEVEAAALRSQFGAQALRIEHVKLRLAAAHHGSTLESRESYSLGKTSFVESVLVKARADGYLER